MADGIGPDGFGNSEVRLRRALLVGVVAGVAFLLLAALFR